MKLFRLFIFFFICTFLSILFSCAPASKTKQESAIVISTNASDTEAFAAQVLQEYLSALDGNSYPIINDDQAFDGFKFCIGETSVYDISDIAGKAVDSYSIVPFRNGLALYGSGRRGTIYSVFSFLEKCCGYRVYTAESGMVSTSGKIVLPKEKIEYNTYFEYRNTDWRSGWNPIFSVANKLNGEYQGGLTREMGGNISYLGGSNHTLTKVFCASDKYFEIHPEYFALNGGERVSAQLCLTNEDVYEIVLEEVLSLLKDHHDPEAEMQIISLSQADNQEYCECDACKALDNANRSHAGSLITFVNRIARAVKEEGYSNVQFDTFAYMYTRNAPSSVVPEDNVIVRLCTYECCFSHPMDDTGCPENMKLMKDLEEWSAICKKLYIWDYTTNYQYTIGIFPDFHVLQRNLQCFYEHGIKGVYEEGNYYIDKCDTEFGYLRTYLIAKLLEDPYCDYEAEMKNFCNYYYGEGGEYIKSVIEEITANIKDHVSIYSPMTESFSINDEEAGKIDHLWDMAEKAAKSSDALAAIKRSKLSWLYVKAALGLKEFSGTLEENKDEREALYNDLISHGVSMINEWTWFEQDFSKYEHIPVEDWEYASRYYCIQFDLNGGTDGLLYQWCDPAGSWISDTIPKRKGYRFIGWATEENASDAEYLPGELIVPSSDIVLFAVWGKASEGEDSESQQGVSVPFGAYDLSIAGVKIDSKNADLIQDLDSINLHDEGYIRYDDSDRTLYLKDVDIIPSEDTESDGNAISYNSQDNTALTIEVEGNCRLKNRDCDMVIGSWGNLNINLQQGSILEIEASPCMDQYTNIGIYIDRDDSDGTLTISGPGILKVSCGDARSIDGASIGIYAQGEIIFEKNCSVSIVSDTASAVSIGCLLEGENITCKDGSQIQILGGSYGINCINDGIYAIYAENWTGRMIVSGSYGALRYERGIDARLKKAPKKIRLTGYSDIGEQNSATLDKEIYKFQDLQKYTKLYFEGCEKD